MLRRSFALVATSFKQPIHMPTAISSFKPSNFAFRAFSVESAAAPTAPQSVPSTASLSPLRKALKDDLKTSMIAKDSLKSSAIRMVLAEVMKKDKESGVDASDADIISLLQRLAKQRDESAKQFSDNGRQDYADKELKEKSIIESFLPKQMTREEILVEVEAAIKELNVTDMKGMGQVIKHLAAKLAGRAANSAVSALVKERLSIKK